jgi:polyhydroxyalkanoate synthesis regulator phasin
MGMIDEKLEAEITTLREAIGLMTTAKPDMVMDVDDPIGMAHQVVKEADTLRARVKELEREVQKLTKCDCGRNLTTGLCRICDNDE